MFTPIDHVMSCVPDLPRGIDHYRKTGFNIQRVSGTTACAEAQ